MEKKITDQVSWVGKVDWELKKFHGEEYTTKKGSSYNSYLIRDEKNVLIDTVWLPHDKEFVKELKKTIPLSSLSAIVMNHGEVDHSGALLELMREIPEVPIYCTANAMKSLKGQYHQDWKFIPVKTKDTLNLGKHTLTFIEAPMLHWPDTMFTYLDQENILFSNDAFGQHFASESLYADKIEKAELYEEAMKYYANIVAPFSPFVTKKIQEITAMNLPISMICPSHGEIITEVFRSKMILMGSSTVNNGYLYSIAGILEMLKGMKLKGKKAAAFGSFGWSGEAVKQITEELKAAKFDIIAEGIKINWTPDEEGICKCIEFGENLMK